MSEPATLTQEVQPTMTTPPNRGGEPDERALAFGVFLRYVREDVYGESIRGFAPRLGISPGYLGKLELGIVGLPRRATVERMAAGISVDEATLLEKAGYAPNRLPHTADSDLIALKLRRIRPDLVPIVLSIIDMMAAQYPAKE